ncbi:MAG: DUF4258 domain-containing protein [Thermohalobaculum sp.]
MSKRSRIPASRKLPDPRKLREIARFIATENTQNLFFTDHALERMEDRDIPDVTVYRVLRNGHIKGDPEPGKNEGEWIIKICDAVRGRREVGVVTIVVNDKKLVITTVEWEDPR